MKKEIQIEPIQNLLTLLDRGGQHNGVHIPQEGLFKFARYLNGSTTILSLVFSEEELRTTFNLLMTPFYINASVCFSSFRKHPCYRDSTVYKAQNDLADILVRILPPDTSLYAAPIDQPENSRKILPHLGAKYSQEEVRIIRQILTTPNAK